MILLLIKIPKNISPATAVRVKLGAQNSLFLALFAKSTQLIEKSRR